MSKRARALVFGAMLAAMNLAGLTAIAQAQTSDEPASNQDARRPPTQGQVGEPYRNYHDARAAQAQTTQDDAVERFHRGERASQAQPTIADDTRRPPTEAQVGESWRHPVSVPVPPAKPSGHPVSLVAWLGVLAAVLALAAGLAMLAARRAGRKVQAASRPDLSSSPHRPMGLPRPPGSPIGNPPKQGSPRCAPAVILSGHDPGHGSYQLAKAVEAGWMGSGRAAAVTVRVWPSGLQPRRARIMRACYRVVRHRAGRRQVAGLR